MNVFRVINTNKIKNVCSICLDDNININKVYQCNQCKYQFHEECLERWIKYKMECPNCRFNDEIFEVDFDMINALLIYNEFEWHNFELYHNLSEYIYTVFFLMKIIILINIFIFIIFYYFK